MKDWKAALADNVGTISFGRPLCQGFILVLPRKNRYPKAADGNLWARILPEPFHRA